MFGVDVLILLFEISKFPSHYGMTKFKLATFVRKLAKIGLFIPQFFGLGARTNNPKDIIKFGTYRVLWQFRENRFRDIEKSVDGR